MKNKINVVQSKQFLKEIRSLLLLLLFLVFSFSTLMAQNVRLKGNIRNTDGEPVPGVTVLIRGTTTGTVTDADGNYTLENVPPNAILVFSFVGMKTQEVKLSGKTTLNLTMEEESIGLGEIVTVGYGTQKKESVVGAISQVNSETLMRSTTSNITTAIAGKLSGVLTIQNTGEPGANDSEIIIRGISSWNSSAPLVLVDGVERDFTDLDPTEINSISVLKDASATAVFGARGANGVIVVTTKRGQLGRPKLDVSASFGMINPTRVPDHIDSYTTMNMLNVAMMNGQQFAELISQEALNEYRSPSSRLKALQYPNVDWFNLLTKPFAPAVNANVSLQGGSDFAKYFCSLAYLYEGDFFKGYSDGEYVNTRYTLNRLNYRANVDFSLTNTLQLSFNLGGDLSIKNQPTTAPWNAMYVTSPARYPAYFPEWVLEEVPDLDYPDASGSRRVLNFGEYFGNPYTISYQGSFQKYFGSKLFTDIVLNQKLDFITKGLSFQGKASLSTYYRNLMLTTGYTFPAYKLNYELIGTSENPWFRESEGNEVYKQAPLDINVGGLSDDFYSDLYYEAGFYYNRVFGKHTVSGLALLNRQQRDLGTAFPYYNEGLVGRATYDYLHKYLVEFNVGYTGSERFAPGNRFGFFPSGAVGWTISEESFFKEAVPWMNKLKLRYSDGLVGSDYAANRWLYISNYSKDSQGYIHEDSGANTKAQWERAHKRDIGVEMGFLKNTLTFNIDFFDEYRDKMLLTPQITMFVGTSFKELNLGEMKKHGFEIEAEYRKKTPRDFEYFVKSIFGFSENRIIFKDDPVYAPEYTKAAGKPVDVQLSGVELTGSGYFTSVDDIHNNPAPIAVTSLNVGDYKYLDYLPDGTITINDTYPVTGSLYPPIVYSFSGGFTLKGFDLSFLFQGNYGKYVEYNETMENEFNMGSWRVHSAQLDYWTPLNPGANHSTLHYSFGNAANLAWGTGSGLRGYDNMILDRFWRNANYLRLKDVYLGYTFKSEFLRHLIGVSNLHVYATGQNLWTITKLIEGDPERKNIEQGTDAGYYVQSSTIKFGCRLAF